MTEQAPAIDDDLPPDEPKVFLSYSRKDRERAQGIAEALRSRHFGVFRDTDDILPTEEWRERLQQLIEEADTIVFLMSPQSIASEVCAWEVEYATSLNKRIAPIVIEDVEGEAIPPLLSRLNFIFCTARDPFENAIDTLSSALSTDIEWVREHTRLAGLARRWREAGEPKRLLLRGQDIADAEAWRDSRPKDSPDITPAHTSLIRESRRAAQSRQRGWIAGSLIVALLTASLSVFAWLQSVEADRQRVEAEVQRAEAELQRAEAEKQRAEAEVQRAVAESERDRAEVERRRAEEQRDLAERRLREALIERAGRNLADGSALISEGRHAEAAPLVREALETANRLGSPQLVMQAEAAARRLLFTDRAHGFLEDAPVADGGYRQLIISPDGAWIASLHLENLRIWSFATGHLTPLQAANVSAIAWLPDNRLAMVRSNVKAQSRSSLTVLEMGPDGSGRIAAEFDHDRQLSDASIHPDQDLVVTSEYRNGDYHVVVLRLSDGVVLFETPAPGQTGSVAVSDDGARIAVAFRGTPLIRQFDPEGRDIGQFLGQGDSLAYAPGSATLAFISGREWRLWRPGEEPIPVTSGGEPADHLLLLPEDRMVARSGLNSVSLSYTSREDLESPLSVSTVFGLAGTIRDGARFLVRYDQQYSVHDGLTGLLLHRIGRTSPPAGGRHLSRTGDYLAIIHQDGLVTVWSTSSGRELLAVRPEGGGRWVHLLERPSGPVVAIMDSAGSLGLWRVEPYDLFFSDSGPIAAQPVDGKVAVAGGYADPLRFWNLATAMPVEEIDRGHAWDTDPLTGRQLLQLEDGSFAVAHPGSEDRVNLQTDDGYDRWVLAWGEGRLASHYRGRIAVHDTASGAQLAIVDPGLDAERPRVSDMAFLTDDRIAILTRDQRLVIAGTRDGAIQSELKLPEAAQEIVPSPDGQSVLIAHRGGVWRHGIGGKELTPIWPDASHVRITGSGAATAVISVFRGDEREAWLLDLNAGETRFRLDWTSTYAVGQADRVVVSEGPRGGYAIRNAQSGAILHTRPGDGGQGGFPSPPRLSPDERWMIAVNGGSEMLRLIDTASGEVRASVERRDGAGDLLYPSHDYSAVTLTEGIRPAMIDMSVAQLDGDALAAALRMTYPAAPEVTQAEGVSSCDRRAAFVNDPQAVANGVDYEAIPFEALETCWAESLKPDAPPRARFQYARAATRYSPDRDAQTVDMLKSLADDGYGAAGYTLAVLMLQGRAPGDLERLERRLRQAGEAGAGVAWVMLSKLAANGTIDGRRDDFLQAGIDAGLPSAMDERARLLATEQSVFGEASRLLLEAAAAYATRQQSSAARRLTDRAESYARRMRFTSQDK